jgi:teichuronic acid biosynthesis glycosyltransferase TuaH
MFLNKTAWIKKIAGFFNRVLIGNLKKYDIVWFCHPVFYDDLSSAIRPEQKVVYDCMDDVLEFPSVKKDPALSAYLSRLEKGLVERSDKVICSAVNLKKKLAARFGQAGKYFLVNNGMNLSPDSYSKEMRLDPKITAALKTPDRKLTYIGTISEWMDFNLLLSALKENGNITCFLFGPLAPGVVVPEHTKIVAPGPVPHDQILHIMKRSDLLVMPFQLSELILSVDPVKLYEYIYSGVPTLALGYPETEKFGKFAYLYKNKKEFLSVIGRLSAGKLRPKQPLYACRKFSGGNTWDHRAKELADGLSGFAQKNRGILS